MTYRHSMSSAMSKVTYDTNQLLDHPDLPSETECAVSFTTLRELDSLKRRPDVKFMAQHAIKGLEFAMSKGMVEVIGAPTKETLNPESPDERIILDCLHAGYKFSTQDIGARVIAKAVGIELAETSIDLDYDIDYTGYIILKGDLAYESMYVGIKEVQYAEFSETFNIALKENQYCIIERIINKDDIWVRKGDGVYRIQQTMKPFRDAGITESPMDSIQMALLDAIVDPTAPLTIVDGRLGTGKTLLSLIGALATVKGQKQFKFYKGIAVTRPNIATDKRYERGFLPGSAEEKDAPWLAGITSNLQLLFERTESDAKDLKATKIFEEFFKIIAMETIQGLSLNGEILLVDEYQLLDRDGILLVLSRIAQGSKVVLIGDTRNQTYHINRGNEGFKLLQPHYGKHKLINFIRLDKVYRSPLAEFVAELMEGN